ncbi:MAG: phosphotransferase [Acidobacteria bacterium]|nr:phosphotransferase [Acidobacteriota bacterium]
MSGSAGDRDRLSTWFRQELPGHLPAWLATQRWVGGKARAIEAVDVQDVVWLPAAARPVALVVVDVAYAPAGPGRHDRCTLLLGLDDAETDTAIAPAPNGGYVTDQAAEGEAVRALLAGLLGGTAAVGVNGGLLVYADTTPDVRQVLSAAAPPVVKPVGVEQSNTSVRIGQTHVFKLFRRLEPGEHPQLEVGRFLAQAGFVAVPRLEGSLIYRGADAQESALGALEGWVVNEGDGWRHLLARLDACRQEVHVRADLYADLVSLGETTADFHAALATETRLDAFSPEPVSATDAALWQQDAQAQAERTFALLGQRLSTLAPDSARLAETVLAARHATAWQLPALDEATTFERIRIHGDYHLGQTLRIPGGFVIIDFEGEPSKPLIARRQKQCALKDVAGMLRSLDYAVATSALAAGVDVAEAAPPAAMRQAFLEGYYAQAARRDGRFLPAVAEARDAWTGLFELEKALYEVEYELNNRPAWVHIPLRALARLLAAAE